MEELANLVDAATYLLQDVVAYVLHQFENRQIANWLYFFLPFFVLGEVPRYILPALILPVLRWFGIPRDDSERKRRFLETQPKVSVLLVGYNEEKSVAKAIRSLLELPYPNLEILVVDDGSNDRMYEVAKPFADARQIKLWKNTAASGRSGRPSSSNLALRMATGEFILSIDADTSFDRDTIEHMIGPFFDPQVGAVAGNLMPRNIGASHWADMQAIEYLVSISLWKRWLNVLGMNMQASGAFGAFRRTALDQVGAWDPELAEDADLSLKVKKCGWKLVFAPDAIASTAVPEPLRVLIGQRVRWEKGALRTYFRKHLNIMDVRRFDPRNALELALEFTFSVIFSYLYAGYLLFMAIHDFLLFILAFCHVVYWVCALITAGSAISFSKRRAQEWPLLLKAFWFPSYKGMFRWVRLYALTLEFLRINYDESYLPQTAWRNTPKW